MNLCKFFSPIFFFIILNKSSVASASPSALCLLLILIPKFETNLPKLYDSKSGKITFDNSIIIIHRIFHISTIYFRETQIQFEIHIYGIKLHEIQIQEIIIFQCVRIWTFFSKQNQS